MKRSEINKALKELEAMCAKYKCYLPPFCNFTPEEWQEKGHEYDEVRDCMLGWDITDYGLGNFDKFGFSLITIRNGCRTQPEKYPKVYAEKLLYLKEGQMAANHFHWFKTEDIINRGGGNCLIRVYNSLPNEEIDYESDVEVHCDGLKRMVPADTQIRLRPGESLWVTQGMYHDFAVEEGTGPVLLGEASQCNDDNTDNRFNPPVGRFPKIEEDEAPYRLLCNEYPAAKDQLFLNQISSFCIGSQLELALQAAPWCHGAGDSKSADVPLGGERPLCYLPSILIMYKFDVQLPFSRCRR